MCLNFYREKASARSSLVDSHRIDGEVEYVLPVCVVFTLTRSVYPATSVHAVSVLIHPLDRATNYAVTECCEAE